MAGGGAPAPKADEPQPHPPKDQLPNISYCITSPPPWRELLLLLDSKLKALKFFYFEFFFGLYLSVVCLYVSFFFLTLFGLSHSTMLCIDLRLTLVYRFYILFLPNLLHLWQNLWFFFSLETYISFV